MPHAQREYTGLYGVVGEKSTGLLWDLRVVAADDGDGGGGDSDERGYECGNKGQKILEYGRVGEDDRVGIWARKRKEGRGD